MRSKYAEEACTNRENDRQSFSDRCLRLKGRRKECRGSIIGSFCMKQVNVEDGPTSPKKSLAPF